jgi:hypothetical protein
MYPKVINSMVEYFSYKENVIGSSPILPFLTVLWCSGELKLVFRTPFCNYLFNHIFNTTSNNNFYL